MKAGLLFEKNCREGLNTISSYMRFSWAATTTPASAGQKPAACLPPLACWQQKLLDEIVILPQGRKESGKCTYKITNKQVTRRASFRSV